jgi:cold-inducible RNA-binding protein
MSMTLYVANLDFQMTGEELQTLFASTGTVESASIVMDRETGRSRGFGFVQMSSLDEGQKAIAQLNGKDIKGRSLIVNVARPRENRDSNRGGYGSNRSSRW